jgi:SAM-dependent methyltransferase
MTTTPARPRRRDVADAYDLGVVAYDALWSPVILPPATGLVPMLGLSAGSVVTDIGAGSGALTAAIRAAAPSAKVIALDASAGMLSAARARGQPHIIQADAVALPLARESADAALLAYVLFHVSDPARAVAETERVLRPGGRAGVVTWARESAPPVYAGWDDILAEAGVPHGPLRRLDTGLDHPELVARLLETAGLRPERLWEQRLRRQWNRTSLLALATGAGSYRVRLNRVDGEQRAEVLARLKRHIDHAKPADLLWEGDIICAIGRKQLFRRFSLPFSRFRAERP